MEAVWPTDAVRVPHNLPPERAWRWCILRTLREVRLARQRGGWMSRVSAERLFSRRWHRVRTGLATATWTSWQALGREYIRSYTESH